MANLSNINNILRTGSLGVGINRDPLGVLEVSSATKSGIKMFNTGASGKTYETYVDASGNYIIYDEDADRNDLVINTSGNATFAGEISSSDDINVNNGKLVVNHASAEVRIKSTSDTGESYISFSDPSDINPGQIYYGHSNNTMSFRANDINQMSISNNLIVFPSTGVHEIRGDRGSGAFAIGNMGDASSQMMVSSRGFLTFNVSNTGSALSATERMRIKSDGNVIINNSVSIGTSVAPTRTLDVRGNGLSIFGDGSNTELMLRGQVEGTGTVRNLGAWHWSVRGDVGGDNDDLKLIRFNTGTFAGTAMQIRSDNGGVAIGLNNEGYASQILSVKSGAADNVFYGESTDANCFASFRDNSSTANIEFGVIGNAHVFRNDTTEKMRIENFASGGGASAKLIISPYVSGTVNRDAWLVGVDDNHSIKFRANAGNKTYYYSYGGDGTDLGHQFYTGGVVASQGLRLGISNDRIIALTNVGIGTTSPDYKLEVEGASGTAISIKTPWAGGAYGQLRFQTGTGNSSIRSSVPGNSTNGLDFYTYSGGESLKMSITGAGTIKAPSLGGYTPTGSDLRYDTSDGEIYYQTSSKRYKTDIVNLESSLDKINTLRPVRYKDINTGEPNCGLIAEETFEIIPDVVFTKQIEGFDEPQIEGLNYSDLVPFLIKSIQELKADNDSLKARIETLENN